MYLDIIIAYYCAGYSHYMGVQPEISVVDIELIKHVTVKDFDHFIDEPVISVRFQIVTSHLLSQAGIY